MYFVKPKKNFENQDKSKPNNKEPVNIKRSDRYHRSVSGSLLSQALPQQKQTPNHLASQLLSADKGDLLCPGQSQVNTTSWLESDSNGFKPEELPDGVSIIPKRDLTGLSPSLSGGSGSVGSSGSGGTGGSNASGGGVVSNSEKLDQVDDGEVKGEIIQDDSKNEDLTPVGTDKIKSKMTEQIRHAEVSLT